MFSLSRYWQTVFQNCCSNLSSHDNHESSSCSTHLPNLWIFRDLKKKFIHSSVSLVILCFCFNLHFLTNYAKQLFIHLLAIQTFLPLSFGLSFFFLITHRSYIFWTYARVFSQIQVLQIFSTFGAFFFYSFEDLINKSSLFLLNLTSQLLLFFFSFK